MVKLDSFKDYCKLLILTSIIGHIIYQTEIEICYFYMYVGEIKNKNLLMNFKSLYKQIKMLFILFLFRSLGLFQVAFVSFKVVVFIVFTSEIFISSFLPSYTLYFTKLYKHGPKKVYSVD